MSLLSSQEFAFTNNVPSDEGTKPVAVIDIGSNSIRLVIYSELSRSPAPIFNEKVLVGLGHGVAQTGSLSAEGINRACSTLRRFTGLCRRFKVSRTQIIATAAVREADNGPQFVSSAEEILGAPVKILSGQNEARYAALGVISGVIDPEGVAGDLGGGSLELVALKGSRLGDGTTLKLGPLWLEGNTGGDLEAAERIIDNELEQLPVLRELAGRNFYAIGGSWRSLAKLHMLEKNYPLRVLHQYTIGREEMISFCQNVIDRNTVVGTSLQGVSRKRREHLPYAALLLKKLIQLGSPDNVVISALGVREGFLYGLLDEAEQSVDPLLAAAQTYSTYRSRSHAHSSALPAWTDQLFEILKIDETVEEKRLRHAACLLSDIGWRAHPDYRGEQTLRVLAHAAFTGIDHSGRSFLALTALHRYSESRMRQTVEWLEEFAGERLQKNAKVIGAALGLAHIVSGAMPGVVSLTQFRIDNDELIFILDNSVADLMGERIDRRTRQLAIQANLKSGRTEIH